MEQVIIGGINNPLDDTDTEYNHLHSGETWSTSESFMQEVVSTGGKIKNLFVELDDSPGADNNYVFTVRVDGSGVGCPTCTIADAATSGSDTTNEIAVSAGDLVCIECVPTGTPTARKARWSVMFEGTTANESLLLGSSGLGAGGQLNPAATEYNQATGGDDWTTTENNFRQVCPTGGVIKNLYVRLSTDPGTDPDAYRFTLRYDGANSDDGEGNPLQVTIVADSTTGHDTTHEIAVAAGHILTIMCEPLDTPSGTPIATWGMTFVATTDGESIIMGGSDGDLDRNATEYNYLAAQKGAAWNDTESSNYQLAQECTLKKLYILLSGSPSQDDNYTFTVRLNGTSPGSGLVVTIADAATTGNDTTNTIAVSDSNELNLMVVPTSSPDSRDAYWGLVCYIAVPVGWAGGDVNGVAIAAIAKINGVALADITKVNGIA